MKTQTKVNTNNIKFKNWIPKNGFIYSCSYCGEQTGNVKKYCSTCTTQVGRKKIFSENVAILKENKAKGLNTRKSLPNWRQHEKTRNKKT